MADFRDQPYNIRWHDERGGPDLADIGQAPENLSGDAAIWPRELHSNDFFRRKGRGGESGGDFNTLKEFVTDGPRVREVLIRAYQYAIAKFDVDGFRIDTLKYVERDFARTFGNAMREYALSIGKKNFFTFGEVFDNEEKIAQFIGRDAGAIEDPIGVDAALDFPLFFELPKVLKANQPPSKIAEMFQHRKNVQRGCSVRMVRRRATSSPFWTIMICTLGSILAIPANQIVSTTNSPWRLLVSTV